MQQCDFTLHIPSRQADFRLPGAWSLFCHDKVYLLFPNILQDYVPWDKWDY